MIAISAGHNPTARGACFGDFCEHAEAVLWVDKLVQLVSQELEVYEVKTGSLTSKVGQINYNKAKLAVEIHFNSDPAHAGKGSESLYCPGSTKGERFAEIVQDAYSPLMLPDRGLKEGWYHGSDGKKPLYFLKKTACPAVIIEPEFIHNKDIIEGKRDEVCEAISKGLIAAYKELVQGEVDG